MTTPPPAPWVLHGEAAAMLASPFAVRLLVNYRDSPVGPYVEHALAKVTARGPHVYQMNVTLEASKIGGRSIWGFPKTLEDLAWREHSVIEFRRQNQHFRIRPCGPRLPFALPFWTVQRKEGRWVRVPGHIRGVARLGFRGRQVALVLEKFEMKIEAPEILG